MKPIAIDDIKVTNLGLGRSIYSPAQLEEFAHFQESQETRRAFLAESAERAYNSWAGGQWGSSLSDLATESLIDAVGYHLVPMYRVIGPTAAEEVDGPSAPKVQLNNLDRLVNWFNEFLGRRDNDWVYPIPINRNEQAARGSSTNVDMNVDEENNRRDQPKH
jgi:hypothetical protein